MRKISFLAAACAVAMAASAAQAQTTFSYAGAPVAILDNTPGVPALAPLTTAGLAGPVQSVTVTLGGAGCAPGGVMHPFVGDLTISLLSPDGTSIALVDRLGVPASTFGHSGDNFCGTVFTDSGLTSIDSALSSDAPFTGSYQPESSLAALAGETANGVWTLVVTDSAAGDVGAIQNWSITITDTAPPAPAVVPTLTEWAMILLAMLLAGGAAIHLGRRREQV